MSSNQKETTDAVRYQSIINASDFSEQEIADAQFDLDHHPEWSPFWDSSRGQESASITLDLGLVPATSYDERNTWHREQMDAAREDENECCYDGEHIERGEPNRYGERP